MAWILIRSKRIDQTLAEAEAIISEIVGDRYEILLVTQTNNKKALREFVSDHPARTHSEPVDNDEKCMKDGIRCNAYSKEKDDCSAKHCWALCQGKAFTYPINSENSSTGEAKDVSVSGEQKSSTVGEGQNKVYLALRKIYCCKGAEFCRPELEMAWKEIDRLERLLEQTAKTLDSPEKEDCSLCIETNPGLPTCKEMEKDKEVK